MVRHYSLVRFWMDLPVSLKGPLTICVSLLATSFVAAALWSLQPETERAEEIALHTTKVEEQALAIHLAAMNLIRHVDDWDITGDSVFKQDFEQRAAGLLRRADDLVTLTWSPEQKKNAVDIRTLLRSHVTALRKEMSERGSAALDPRQSQDVPIDHDRLLDLIEARLERFLKAEEGIFSARMHRVKRLNRSMRTTLLAAAWGAILLAMLGAWVFSRTISSRLRRLVSDAEAVGRGEGIPMVQEAGDEIGRAERALQRSAEMLTQRDRVLNESRSALAASLERFNLAVKGAMDGIWDWDLIHQHAFYSDRCAEMLGCNPAELKTSPEAWMERILAEDREEWQRKLALCMRGEAASLRCEYRMRHSSGSVIWILARAIACRSESGTAYRMAGSFVDITQRKVAEEELQRSHNLLSAVIEGTTEAIFVKDLDLRFIMLNSAAARYLETNGTQVLGRKADEIFPPDVAAQMDSSSREVMARNCSHTFENSLKLRDGGVRSWLTNVGPWHDRDGHILGVIGVAHDITERQLKENQIEASLAEKEILLKEIHHRVKNNLQVISGLLYLQAELVDDPKVKVALERSRNRLQSIALIHERLYKTENLSKIDFRGYFEPWKKYIVECNGIDTERVGLSSDIDAAGLTVDEAIPCALILSELVTNSLQHAFPASRRGCVQVQFRVNETECRLAVSDDGVGLPAAFGLEDSPSLGLRLIWILARQLKGIATLDRATGTRVEVVFPRKTERGSRKAA